MPRRRRGRPRPSSAQSLDRSIDTELAEAEALGLIDIVAERLRFSHPLLREFVYAEATSAARRQAHAQLAAVVDEPVENATHRALATQEADADLAAPSRRPRRRGRTGAPGAAATLWRLAAERTPGDLPDDRARRLTRAADDAAAAGHLAESAEMARLAVQAATRPETKVPRCCCWWTLLGRTGSAGRVCWPRRSRWPLVTTALEARVRIAPATARTSIAGSTRLRRTHRWPSTWPALAATPRRWWMR